MTQEGRYSLQVSTEYIYSLLFVELLVNLGVFAILYFSVYKKVIVGHFKEDLYSQLLWAIFVVIMFLVFALTFIFANGPRYWINNTHIERWLIYRPKKRETLEFNKLTDIRIRAIPLASAMFNIGTIELFVSRKGKPKKAMRLIGIKDYTNIYLDLIKKANLKETISDDLMSI